VRTLLFRSARFVMLVAILAGLGWAGSHYVRPVRVAGGSMRPALSPGDLAVVDVRAPVRADQIALLRSPRHGLFLHRVVEMAPDGSVRTRGDANTIPDFDSLPASAVVGPVVLVAPIGKLIERWRGSAACDTMTAQ
jgi:signal peptidase I